MKKTKLHEFGLIELLFSPSFLHLSLPRSDPPLPDLSSSWSLLWDSLSLLPDSQASLSPPLLSTLVLHTPHQAYLTDFLLWFNKQIQGSHPQVLALLNDDLLPLLLAPLLSLQQSELLIEFFVMIKSIVYTYEIPVSLGLRLTDFTLQQSLITDKNTSELALSCMVALLRNQPLPCYDKLVQVIRNCRNRETIRRLLESVQDIVKESETKKNCQINLVKSGIFGSIRGVLIENQCEEDAVELWPVAFECVRFLVHDNRACKMRLCEVDFRHLAMMLVSEKMQEIQYDISEKCIEIALNILFESTNLDIFHEVITPDVIPCVVAMMGVYTSHFSQYLLSCLEYPYNAAYFSMHYTTEVVLEIIETCYTGETLEFLLNLLGKILIYHASPLELKKIINITQKISKVDQILLCRNVAKAVGKCFVQSEDGEGPNQIMLNTTEYFWFHKPHSHILLHSEHLSLLPKKDFTFIIWAYPLSKNLGCIADLTDKKSHFQIFVTERRIRLLHSHDKKNIFHLETGQVLIENQWNLICISFQQITKFISSQNIYEITVNNRACEYSTEGKISNISLNHISLYLGNSQDLQHCFNGKISLFYICNKAFTDFSNLYSAIDDHTLPFIPEVFSLSSSICSDQFLDLVSSVHLGLTTTTLTEDIEIVDFSEKVAGTDMVSAFIAIGGLEALFPLLKHAESQTALPIVEIIANFSKSVKFSYMISEDFFELLARLLENAVIPTEELLEAVKQIIGRLEWDSEGLQNKAFKNLMLNSKIWGNLPESLQENYVGTLSMYVPRHLSCVLEDCFILYSHLFVLSPLPVNFLSEIYSKILPKTIETKNIVAISYLLFRMSSENTDLMDMFLKEMANCRFSKDCINEITYLLLYFADWINSFSILPGLLTVFKPIIENLVKEWRAERKDSADIFTIIFNSFDRRLGQDLSLECFNCIISIAFLSDSYNNPDLSEKFNMFIDLITTRVVVLSEECISLISKYTSDPKFCRLITSRPNFPDWLIGCYYSDLTSAIDLGVTLFSLSLQRQYLHKLRVFLLTISKQNINKGLDFYNRVLEKLMKLNMFKQAPHYFLDFCAILEDMLNPELTGRMALDPPCYICTIISLVQYSLFLNLIHCTYPPLPRIDLVIQYEILREKPMEIILQQDTIYQREGGFLRMILKYIFMGLQSCQSQLLVTALKIVLRGGQETEAFPLLSQKTDERVFGDFELERYSIAYPHFPVRNGDMLYSEEFICLYTLAEITEILNSTADQGIIDFTLDFLQNIEVPALLTAWSKKITEKELECLYKMIKDTKHLFYATARSRLHSAERSLFAEKLKGFSAVSLHLFQNYIHEQSLILADAKSNELLLRDLLVSSNWIFRVHIFLIAYTSMKLNLIAGMVKIPSFHLRKSSAPEVLTRHSSAYEEPKLQTNFAADKQQEEIKNLHQTYFQKQETKRKVCTKKLMSILKRFNKINTAFVVGKLKLRYNSDSLGRMATCYYEKGIHRAWHRKKTVISSMEPKFKASALTTQPTDYSAFETFVEESEFSGLAAETEEEIVEEQVPDLAQSIQVECEKIKVTNSIFGDLEISQGYLLFTSEGKEKPAGGIFFGSSLKFMQETKNCTVLCGVSEIAEVFPRRYIHKHTAFEVYLKSGKSYFINVFTVENRDKVFTAMNHWRPVKLVLDPHGAILRSYTRRWKRCEISNLEYLLIVNKFASRSFHDLSQYPIFPWVLKDYTSDELKLDDPSFYRNLKLPIGAQTDNARQDAETRFTIGMDEQSYHFGSHYSTGAIVLHYLVRLEPFSSLAKALQGGSFDIADRLFHSVEDSWKSGQGSTGDVKELIPEMYYMPEIFMNTNKEILGVRQNGLSVEDVDLPKWASSPVDFIRKHLQALESNYVSQNLNHWIDMVFGCKQKGKQARGIFNLFYPMSYEDNYKKMLESGESEGYLQGMVEQVVHFGQTPVRVLSSPHTTRDTKPNESNIFDKYRKFSEGTIKGCKASGEICALLLTTRYLILVKHYKAKASILRISINDLDENHVMFERKKEKILFHSKFGPVHSPHHYTLLGETRIISGNHLDKSVKVHSLSGKLLNSLHGHTDIVNCVLACKTLVFSASKDTSVVSWKYSGNKVEMACRYLGHIEPVVQLCALANYQLVFSLSAGGKILIHEIRTGECLRGIQTDFIGICVSNLKTLAGYSANEMQVLDFQGTSIWRRPMRVSFAKFDNTGSNLYYCGVKAWGFFNVFEENKRFEKCQDNLVNLIQLSTDQNYFIHAEMEEGSSLVFTFEVPNKDMFILNQGIKF